MMSHLIKMCAVCKFSYFRLLYFISSETETKVVWPRPKVFLVKQDDLARHSECKKAEGVDRRRGRKSGHG